MTPFEPAIFLGLVGALALLAITAFTYGIR